MPQIDDIRSNMGALTKAGMKGGLAVLAGLSAAIVTGSAVPLIPALMLGGAGALTEALPLISNKMNIKKKPIYIWHRLTKK